MNKVLLATRNRKKLVELQRILDGALGAHRIALLGLDDVEAYPELPETGLTFGENALIKAREGCRRAGLPTIADDSGLAVDALNGMPGVFSARWAGRHGDDQANLQLVLDQIADLPTNTVPRRSSAPWRWCCPAARSTWSTAVRPAGCCARRVATAVSGTTRSSSARARSGPTRS